MPNLNLPVPSVTPGPAWAQMNNTALGQIAQESSSRQQGIPVLISGNYYGSGPIVGASTGAPAVGVLHATPFWIPSDTTLDRIEIEVTTLIASGVARLGIYTSALNGRPDALSLDAGTVATTTTGVKSITINKPLTMGLYYLVCVNQTAAATLRMISGDLSPVNGAVYPGSALWCGYSMTGVTGALPATFTTFTTQTLCPRVMVRAA